MEWFIISIFTIYALGIDDSFYLFYPYNLRFHISNLMVILFAQVNCKPYECSPSMPRKRIVGCMTCRLNKSFCSRIHGNIEFISPCTCVFSHRIRLIPHIRRIIPTIEIIPPHASVNSVLYVFICSSHRLRACVEIAVVHRPVLICCLPCIPCTFVVAGMRKRYVCFARLAKRQEAISKKTVSCVSFFIDSGHIHIEIIYKVISSPLATRILLLRLCIIVNG